MVADQQAAHDGEGHRAPEHGRRDRDQAQHRRDGGQHDRREARAAGVDRRLPHALARGALGLDLSDQDHRVLGDHADQREHAENGDEAERAARNQERRDDADQPERRDGQHQRQPLEAPELEHQHGQHDQQHQRNHRHDRRLRLRALLDRSAGVDPIPRRQRLGQRLDRGRESVDDRVGQHAGERRRPAP